MSAPGKANKRRRNRTRGSTEPPALTAESRAECSEVIGYKFKEPVLLDRAMTHRSAVPGKAAEWSNERLEFLGDRVLGLVVSEALLERFPNTREGELAPRLNSIVSGEACAVVGDRLKLDRFLIVDRSEKLNGAAMKPSLLANATEALLGAVYLDGGFKAAQKLVKTHWHEAFRDSADLKQDPKSRLQEWAQGLGKPAPVYSHVRQGGPDHAPDFVANVAISGLSPASGKGNSKQEAERAAATAMLKQTGVLTDD